MNILVCGDQFSMNPEYTYSCLHFMNGYEGPIERINELGFGGVATYAMEWSTTNNASLRTWPRDLNLSPNAAREHMLNLLFSQEKLNYVVLIGDSDDNPDVMHTALLRNIPVYKFNGVHIKPEIVTR